MFNTPPSGNLSPTYSAEPCQFVGTTTTPYISQWPILAFIYIIWSVYIRTHVCYYRVHSLFKYITAPYPNNTQHLVLSFVVTSLLCLIVIDGQCIIRWNSITHTIMGNPLSILLQHQFTPLYEKAKPPWHYLPAGQELAKLLSMAPIHRNLPPSLRDSSLLKM